MDGAAAQETYLAMVAPSSRTAHSLRLEEDELCPDFERLRLLSRQLADELTWFVDHIRAVGWDDDVSPAAQDLAACTRTAIVAWRRRAATTSLTAWRAVCPPTQDDADARMRCALGLPPAA